MMARTGPAPDPEDADVAVVRGIAARRYESVGRDATSAFLQLTLGGNLEHRGLAPDIYESRQEALGNLGERT